MPRRFRITASEGISVALEFDGDEVHIIASFSTNSTMVKPQVKEDDEVVSSVFQKGKTTDLSEEEISAICEEYKTTSLQKLAIKYHVHWHRIRSILEENGMAIKRRDNIKASSEASAENRIPKATLGPGYTTDLSEEQIASICEEYAITSIRDLSKKYHISQKRLYSILNEHGVQIRKHGQHSAASKESSAKTYNWEEIDNIIEKREVSQLRTLYYAINKANGISAEELLKDHKFPIEFLEFATSEFELFTKKFILKMYNMGYSLDAISTRIKKPNNQVRQLIPDSIIRSRGDKSHSILTGEKLNDSEKQAIRTSYINGEDLNELTDRFGVSLQTVKRYAL